jgi:hypothetical protein
MAVDDDRVYPRDALELISITASYARGGTLFSRCGNAAKSGLA